jgi:hypothetical protein
MDLKNIIDQYDQNFLVVHVVTDTIYERFMVTKFGSMKDCYTVYELIETLKSRNIVPKKIAITNTPFGFVNNWIDIK